MQTLFEILFGLFGLSVLVAIAWLFSNNKGRVEWKLVATGVALQIAFADAASRTLNPALSSFNAGVRGYYFALAAAAWLFGPQAFFIATVGAVALLVWRQRQSSAAKAIADLRKVIDRASAQP